MNNKNLTFMAFAAGQDSKDAVIIPRYIGVGAVNVIAVNPNKAQLKEIFNMELEDEPVYIGIQEQDGQKIEYARLDLVVQTVPELNDDIDLKTRLSFFIRNQFRYNRDKTKIQVVDEFGRSGWVTKEELDKHAVPIYSNGQPANLTTNYRPCYVGEEDIISFFKTFLSIPSPTIKKGDKWVPADNLDLCRARFDEIAKTFKGDFSEFINTWKLRPHNKVKVLFGVRTSGEGKQYQTFYPKKFMSNSATTYDSLAEHLRRTKEAGGLSTSEFQVVPLQEYVVNSTPLENSQPAAANPFGNPSENPFFQ